MTLGAGVLVLGVLGVLRVLVLEVLVLKVLTVQDCASYSMPGSIGAA